MKKKVLASLLCASMVATMFAGCGSDNGGNGTEKADKKDGGKETITVMGPAEDLDDAQGAWLKTECEAFAKANPDFNIEFKYVTSSESDAKDVVTKDPKAAADVYMFANDQLEPLIKADAIAKLGGETADYVKTSNSEAMAATVTYDGDIYAVPYTSNTWFMYYDKRVFSEDDVKSLDTMLTKGKVSFPFDNGWYLNAFYAANGCTIFGDGTDKAAGYDFGGDKGTAVTNYIVDLFANPNFVMDNNEGSLGLAGLKDGSINAYFNGNWNYDKVKEALGEENVGVAALPTIKKLIADGGKVILGSEDAQLAHFKLRGQAPVNKNLATNEEIAADPVAAAMAKVSTDCSVAQPIIDMSGYWDAATPFGDAFQNGAEGQITKDNAAQKTEDFNTQLNDSLK